MASSSETKKPYFRYDIIKNVWTAYFRRRCSFEKYTTALNYFGNYVVRHRTTRFYIMKIFDGTRHVVVDKELHDKIRGELEAKTSCATLPDINFYDTSDSRNEIERQRSFTTQMQLNNQLEELESENSKIYQRARQDAAEHKSQLCKVLNEKKDTKFLCFDLEMYDQDRKTMLEIGYVKFTLKAGETPEYFHAVVNEELHNREGFDNKEKFRFGTTVRMPLKEAAEELKKAVVGSDALLTHSGFNDKQYLAENGIDIEDKPMFDTQKLALNLLYSSKIRWWALKRMMDEMNISYDESILHNAGNDAHYTMMAFKALVKRAMPTTRF